MDVKDLVNKINQKKYNEVINLSENFLKKEKNYLIYNIYGIALQKTLRFKESIKAFKKSLILKKKNLDAMNNLANSYSMEKDYVSSEKTFKEIFKINPNFFISLLNYSNLKLELMIFDEAIENYKKALINSPSKFYKINILFKLCSAYEAIGSFENVRECANKILFLDTNNVTAHSIISKLNDYSSNLLNLEEMINISKIDSLSDGELIDLNFALGKAYEDQKNFEESYKFYMKANKIKKKNSKYKFIDHLKLQNSIKTTFKDYDFSKSILSDFNTKILFIVGMPRSGTSLVEIILSSHKDIVATGESNFINLIIKENFIKNFLIDKSKVLQESQNLNNMVQNKYFQMLLNRNIKSNIITDKTVQNYMWIGFIKIFFPNSKIIICNRDPKDICTSIFKINFTSGFMDWSYDYKDIANFYNLYSELIDFWKSKFSNEIYNINYENLILNPKIEIKKLIDFCEVSWDENCLNHVNNKSPINTASNFQARQPIYNSSLNNYKNYEKYLKNMFRLIK